MPALQMSCRAFLDGVEKDHDKSTARRSVSGLFGREHCVAFVDLPLDLAIFLSI
jgi:hypothetical protein